MSSKGEVINKTWKPPFIATGSRVFVKIDTVKEVDIGDMKVDATTGMTASGLYIPEETKNDFAEIQNIGQIMAEVVSVGPSAFKRMGLDDMVDSVVEGSVVAIEEFSAKPLRDDKGQRTLYYHVKEHQIIGVQK